MSKRVLLVICQPCVFCEQTIYESALWRDDETGAEEWSNSPAPAHLCDDIAAILRERIRG